MSILHVLCSFVTWKPLNQSHWNQVGQNPFIVSVYNNIVSSCISGSDDLSAKLWDVRTGQCIYGIQTHTCATVKFDEQKLVTGSFDNTIACWEWSTGAKIQQFRGHTGAGGLRSYVGGKLDQLHSVICKRRKQVHVFDSNVVCSQSSAWTITMSWMCWSVALQTSAWRSGLCLPVLVWTLLPDTLNGSPRSVPLWI